MLRHHHGTHLKWDDNTIEITQVECCGIPLKPKYGLTPISCHDVLERSACAPFIKERRMECINATTLRRK
jgi:hypothetical protein